MYAALTMALGIGSFGDCRANSLTNFLITFSKWKDSAIWVGGGSLQLLELTGNGGRALHVPPVDTVGESVPSFSCCLGGVHNLASDTCCRSLHRKVDVFVKLGDPFSSQPKILTSCGNELVLVPVSHLCIQSQHRFEILVNPFDP